MVHEKIRIQVEGSNENTYLYTYFLDDSPEFGRKKERPVVLICPGGGYGMTSDREAEPIAMKILANGYHAAVLRYSCAPAVYPTALLEVGKAMVYLHKNAAKFKIDTDQIFIQGSSAGGHLAASYGVFWTQGFLRETLVVEQELLKPAGLILSYPVITSGKYAHGDSFHNLLGSRYEELKDVMSLEHQVNEDTPPTFLWHTAADDTVSAQNSILFAGALAEHNISAEFHLFPQGGHGLGLANRITMNTSGTGIQKECEKWIDLACEWIEQQADKRFIC